MPVYELLENTPLRLPPISALYTDWFNPIVLTAGHRIGNFLPSL
ncbi:hypothetical protein SAMN02927923_02002 [Microvirga guangxiensis]|uniref:Uncharacterized protein n=1 Tax=Microvirga guangxiensis TaxID=549386 RepID=A0A1G5I1L4_9HYPH|nr:hypothetical protein SAMN02927923_02002 [Microvirga guangxiensis]